MKGTKMSYIYYSSLLLSWIFLASACIFILLDVSSKLWTTLFSHRRWRDDAEGRGRPQDWGRNIQEGGCVLGLRVAV
jgi:hypothetical protein